MNSIYMKDIFGVFDEDSLLLKLSSNIDFANDLLYSKAYRKTLLPAPPLTRALDLSNKKIAVRATLNNMLTDADKSGVKVFVKYNPTTDQYKEIA